MPLTITPEAAVAIRRIVIDREEAGLRITSMANDGDGGVDIRVTVAEAPEATDEVVIGYGAKVFIDRRLSPVLGDMTLDLADSAGQAIGFRLVP